MIMKKQLILVPALLSVSLSPLFINNHYQKANGLSSYRIHTTGEPTLLTSLPTTIDLNPVSEEEVRNYYSDLNELSEDQRQGTNLLKNLKSILYDMNYFKYGGMGAGGVTHIYTVTDRDWNASPVSSFVSGTYNSETNQITGFNHKNEKDNPDLYVKMLYADYTKVEKTPFKKPTDQSQPNFDKEHVWCQSRGFKGKDGETATGPAGTDLHHLIAGDSMVNQDVHNNNPYGFVQSVTLRGDLEYTSNNLKGTIKHTSSQDQANVVFEPQDQDKGDIARAIFYMAARYNNYSGLDPISTYEPNLIIANYATSNGAAEYSSSTHPVAMGILSDLLAWNKLDPVDDYEIRRNDLIYRNYQGNRNPFIDFPQWADAIWGTSDIDGSNYNPTVVGSANPKKDSINDQGLSVSSLGLKIELNKSLEISATTSNGSSITWTLEDSSIAELSSSSSQSGEKITVKGLKVGETKLVVKAVIDSKELTKTVTISVYEPPKINWILIAGIAGGVVVLAIFFIIIYATSSKKTKNKIKKAVKKGAKAASKRRK